jgi:hypothetical protein
MELVIQKCSLRKLEVILTLKHKLWKNHNLPIAKTWENQTLLTIKHKEI